MSDHVRVQAYGSYESTAGSRAFVFAARCAATTWRQGSLGSEGWQGSFAKANVLGLDDILGGHVGSHEGFKRFLGLTHCPGWSLYWEDQFSGETVWTVFVSTPTQEVSEDSGFNILDPGLRNKALGPCHQPQPW